MASRAAAIAMRLIASHPPRFSFLLSNRFVSLPPSFHLSLFLSHLMPKLWCNLIGPFLHVTLCPRAPDPSSSSSSFLPPSYPTDLQVDTIPSGDSCGECAADQHSSSILKKSCFFARHEQCLLLFFLVLFPCLFPISLHNGMMMVMNSGVILPSLKTVLTTSVDLWTVHQRRMD